MKNISGKIPEGEVPEFTGQIIDIFNDFLTEHGISRYDLGNQESVDPLDESDYEYSVVIFGSQYDEIAGSVKSMLEYWDLIE
mgnify:CR=1 FL=1